MSDAWSGEAWDASVSAKAYNADWWDSLTPEKEPDLWAELRALFEEEQTLGSVPEWAEEIAARMMVLPLCGHCAYPDNITQIIDAISDEQCPDIVMRCYTVNPERKILLSYYVFCLDAWVKDAPLDHVVAELSMRDQLGKNWDEIASRIYETLGERTDIKTVAVQRLNHRLRWWMKTLIWSDDRRNRFLLDVYSGDIRGDANDWGTYGNPPYGDPYFVELALPHVKAMEERLVDEIPGGRKLVERIHSTWLCAPKAFRYLERLIAQIGAVGSVASCDNVPPFLQCEDTYPDFDANHEHFVNLVEQLQRYADGDDGAVPSIRGSSPVKRWLVHLLQHQLVFQARYEENFGRLVGMKKHGTSGSRRPEA